MPQRNSPAAHWHPPAHAPRRTRKAPSPTECRSPITVAAPRGRFPLNPSERPCPHPQKWLHPHPLAIHLESATPPAEPHFPPAPLADTPDTHCSPGPVSPAPHCPPPDPAAPESPAASADNSQGQSPAPRQAAHAASRLLSPRATADVLADPNAAPAALAVMTPPENAPHPAAAGLLPLRSPPDPCEAPDRQAVEHSRPDAVAHDADRPAAQVVPSQPTPPAPIATPQNPSQAALRCGIPGSTTPAVTRYSGNSSPRSAHSSRDEIRADS